MAGVFDKLIAGVNKGVTTVGANSKALIEKTKHNTAISALENERDKFLKSLGQQIYDKYRADDSATFDDVVVGTISEIGRCNETIARHRDEIKRIDEEVKRVLAEADEAAAVASASSASSSESGCTCGFENPLNSKFCAKCGKSLNT